MSLFSTVIPKPPPVCAGFVPILALGGPCGGWATHTPNSFPIHIICIYAERFRTRSTIRGGKRRVVRNLTCFSHSEPFRAGQRPVRPSGTAPILGERVWGGPCAGEVLLVGGGVAGATPPYQQQSDPWARQGQRPPMLGKRETACNRNTLRRR